MPVYLRILDFVCALLYWTANEEPLQTKKFFAKKILFKEKDGKKAKKILAINP